MKTYRRYIFQTLALFVGQCLNLLFGQVALVGTTKVELIAILLCLYRTKNGAELRQFYLADACQLVVYLLLLHAQLLLVRQLLPLATTTYAKMLAEGLRAYLTIFLIPNNFGLHERVFLATYL